MYSTVHSKLAEETHGSVKKLCCLCDVIQIVRFSLGLKAFNLEIVRNTREAADAEGWPIVFVYFRQTVKQEFT